MPNPLKKQTMTVPLNIATNRQTDTHRNKLNSGNYDKAVRAK